MSFLIKVLENYPNEMRLEVEDTIQFLKLPSLRKRMKKIKRNYWKVEDTLADWFILDGRLKLIVPEEDLNTFRKGFLIASKYLIKLIQEKNPNLYFELSKLRNNVEVRKFIMSIFFILKNPPLAVKRMKKDYKKVIPSKLVLLYVERVKNDIIEKASENEREMVLTFFSLLKKAKLPYKFFVGLIDPKAISLFAPLSFGYSFTKEISILKEKKEVVE